MHFTSKTIGIGWLYIDILLFHNFAFIYGNIIMIEKKMLCEIIMASIMYYMYM